MFLLLIGGVLSLLVIFLLIIPYIRVILINRKYPDQSKVIFAPVIGVIYHQLKLEAKNKDPLDIYFDNRKPNQKFIVSNLLSRPFIMLEDETLVK